MIVNADREYDRFGNVITGQSYYRTGGDVNVITSQEIDQRHYAQLSDALKYIPGVQVMSPGGYRGGEYGYAQTHTMLSINGDTRVLVLIDGRRMDNTAGNPISSNSGSGPKSTVDINQLISMDAIDKIEVIKGPGASIYGADATGGVINIITKKGAQKSVATIDLSTGSWERHNYKLSYSGSDNTGKFRYFLAAGRELGGDSHYKDGVTNKNYKWYQTGYKDDSLNIRLDYDFDEIRSLSVNYNYMRADDDYPLTAPDYPHLNKKDWENSLLGYNVEDRYGQANNPGYRNIWLLWQGAYSAYNKNNLDVTYRFNKDHGMESYIRFYNQNERYWGSWGAGDGVDWSPVPLTPEFWEWVKNTNHYASRNKKSWFDKQQNHGFQFQYGKRVGIHDLLTTWTYDKSSFYNINTKTGLTSSVKRDSIIGYVQDKVHLTDDWEITPSVRYAHYSDVAQVAKDGTESNAGKSVNSWTPSINTQYAFNDSASMYLGYSKVYRPLRAGDYTRTNTSGKVETPADLNDERGDVWTIGVRKDFGDRTSVAIHYDYTDMSNAIARYSVWDKNIQDFNNKYVNAEETKKAINLTLSHQFDSHWTMTFNYAHATDKWSAKNGDVFDPELSWANGNVNNAINRFVPANTYTVTLTYDNNRFNSSLLANYYTGCNTNAFTDNRFLVLDWSMNYDVSKELSVYGTVTNLTNEAYETTYYAYLGMGAWPQPGRAFMIGAKYKF